MNREKEIAELREIAAKDGKQTSYPEIIEIHSAKKALVIIDRQEEELEERRAYIVANPCAQCGGRINAKKCEAAWGKIQKLEAENRLLAEENFAVKGLLAASVMRIDYYEEQEKELKAENEKLKEKLETAIEGFKVLSSGCDNPQCDKNLQAAEYLNLLSKTPDKSNT